MKDQNSFDAAKLASDKRALLSYLLEEEGITTQKPTISHEPPDQGYTEQILAHLGESTSEEIDLLVSKMIARQPANLTTDEKRTLLVELFRQETPEFQIAPLSFTQERLWFLEQLLPENISNIVQVARLVGQLDATALEQSITGVVRRHEILRVTITTLGGQPVQIVALNVSLPVSFIDLGHLPTTARQSEIQRLIGVETDTRFDLVRGPLCRASLLRLADEEHILILNLHHIVSDGWSMGILIRELGILYQALSAGHASPLPDLPIQYTDFVRWQRERLQGGGLNAQLAYWKQRLGDAPAILHLPTDRPRPLVRTFHSAELPLTFPRNVSKALKALSQQEESTLFMTLLAALNVLLFRYSGQQDICVGTIVANRTVSQLEELIGFFTNVIVLRTDLSGNPTFRQLLGRVLKVTLEAYAHQDIPFDKVLEQVRPEYDQSHTPLFQVMFIFQNMPIPEIELSGLIIQLLEAKDEAPGDTDLVLFLWDTPKGLAGLVGYDTDLFDTSTIRRMFHHFENLLTAIAAAPDEKVVALPLMTPQERHELIVKLNRTQTDYPAEMTIQELFAVQAERSPNVVALSCAGESLTYAQLNARANQVAHYLQGLGVGPDILVGIAMTRSPEMIVALLGVLKAGGAYLPLDPTYPAERSVFMMNDAQVKILLTQKQLAASMPAPDTPIIILDDTAHAAIAQEPTGDPASVTQPDHLAYVIYTSGSTGQPKGVMVSQRALVQYATAAIDHLAIAPDDRVLQFASISFDTAAEEIYPCLLQGATLVLRTEAMLDSAETFLQTCKAEGITMLDLPTAYWHTLTVELEAGSLAFPSSLRLVIIGGEAALPERLETWQTYAPAHTRLVNTYGPTETTIVATMCPLTGETAPESAARAPIGKPVANTQVYVLDPHLQPAPVGVPGELYIGGDDLARGYLNRPGLTAAMFVPDSFGGVTGARLYKTGDLVRYLPDDNLEFLIRMDRQVKIRGFRVELAEIQSVLSQHPAVRETAVLARKDASGNNKLIAYVVPSQEHTFEPGDLASFLREKLPDYMIPPALVLLDALPLTPSGKIDWRALPEDGFPSDHGVEFVAPEDPLEEKLAEIWSQVLGVERIGIYDNFFDLGGHSLLATQVIHRINGTFQMKLSVRNLFEEPTIAGLGMVIKEIMLQELEESEE